MKDPGHGRKRETKEMTGTHILRRKRGTGPGGRRGPISANNVKCSLRGKVNSGGGEKISSDCLPKKRRREPIQGETAGMDLGTG